MILKTISILTFAGLFAVSAQAHDFWLQPQSFQIHEAGTAPLTIEIGHGADRNSWAAPLHRVVRFDAHHANGVTDLQPALHRVNQSPELKPKLSASGLNLISMDTTHAFSELDGATFTDYLTKEGLTPALTQREIIRTQDQPGRELYSRRAKTLVRIGEPQPGDERVATSAIGQTLEIIPLANPYSLTADEGLLIEVRYQGKPLSGALVKLRQLDEGEEVFAEHTTDENGQTNFSFPHSGTWLLAVIWTRSLSGNPDAEWDTTFSSLSIGWPDASTDS